MQSELYAENGEISLYQSNFYLPEYKEGINGNWKISYSNIGFDRGYFTGTWMYQNLPVLSRRKGSDTGWETWMSLSPYELESQELCCRYAYGKVVIMGLGMGWVAINAALNSDVKSVTVIERDPEVIELFRTTINFAAIPNRAMEKITVVLADALTWQPSEQIDFLYADIWLHIDEKETVEQAEIMQQNINAQTIYFWGQEFPIYRAAQANLLNQENIQQAVKQIGLPLLIPNNYAELLNNLVAQRRSRGLGME